MGNHQILKVCCLIHVSLGEQSVCIMATEKKVILGQKQQNQR